MNFDGRSSCYSTDVIFLNFLLDTNFLGTGQLITVLLFIIAVLSVLLVVLNESVT